MDLMPGSIFEARILTVVAQAFQPHDMPALRGKK